MALFEPCLLSDGKLCAAVKFFSLVKRNRDLAGFCGMDILTVGTDLFLEDPAIGKDQLFHFTWFWRHKLHILSSSHCREMGRQDGAAVTGFWGASHSILAAKMEKAR